MLNVALNLLVFGMSQTSTVTCFIIFLVIAVACAVGDTVLIVQVRKSRVKSVEDVTEEQEQPQESEEAPAEPPAEYTEKESYDQDSAEEVADNAAEDAEDEEAVAASDEATVIIPVDSPEGRMFVKVRYNRSYTAKLIQADEILKKYYSEVKNEIMRYGLKSRISWRHETFRKGRKLLVKMTVRRKTLYVYLALDPAAYEGTKYKIRNVSGMSSNSEVPTLYRIRNDRRCRYVKQLIAEVMAQNGIVAGKEQNVDYAAQYPYEELESLVDHQLVKIVSMNEVTPEATAV